MVPAIKPNSCHVEIFAPYSNLRIGDTVNYLSPYWHKPICHRIVAGWPGKWVTKGDANSAVDRGYCTEQNYIAEVIP